MSARHVGFSLDDDFIERDSKLRRRDTPHHLKNKRISGIGIGVGKIESEEEKVRRILALVSAGNNQPLGARPTAASEPLIKASKNWSSYQIQALQMHVIYWRTSALCEFENNLFADISTQVQSLSIFSR